MSASESELESISDSPSEITSKLLEGDKDALSDDTKSNTSNDGGGKMSANELLRARNVVHKMV